MHNDTTPQFLLTLLVIAVVTGIALIVKIQDLRAVNANLVLENEHLGSLIEHSDIRRASSNSTAQ